MVISRISFVILHYFVCRLIAISVVFNYHRESFWECEGGDLLRAYYIGLLVLLCLCIVLNMVIVYVSMQGSITNTAPRKKIVKILYVKFVISIPELVWNTLGTYWSFSESSTCEKFVVRTAQGAVTSGWILAVLVIIGILVVFDPLGRQRRRSSSKGLESDEGSQVADSAMVATRKAWEKR